MNRLYFCFTTLQEGIIIAVTFETRSASIVLIISLNFLGGGEGRRRISSFVSEITSIVVSKVAWAGANSGS